MNTESRLLGDRYRIGKPIGSGGMGDVHLGTDIRLGRTIGIKILRSQLIADEDFRRRFRQEAQSAARMNHPNIVRTYDTGEDEVIDGAGNTAIVPYIVMEYVEGKTVKDLIRSGSLTAGDAVRITTDVLYALGYAHKAGLVHRDIKPGNVMVSVAGVVKVMDFGVAKAVADSSATVAMTAHVMGTATYFSPEQAKGESVDSRSDLYSTGVMLYEMLTGQPPFHGESPTAIAYQHVNVAPVPPEQLNPEVTPALSRVVMTALAKSPDARYATAKEFSDDLLATTAGHKPLNADRIAAAEALRRETPPPTQAMLIPQQHSEASTVAAPTTLHELLERASAEQSGPEVHREKTDVEGAKKRKLILWIAVVVLGLATIGSLIWFFALESSTGSSSYSVTIPDVTGSSADTAQSQLQSLGLTVTTSTQADSTVAKDSVISISPVAGTKVTKGSTVTVIVSSGPAQVSLPALKGLDLTAAKAKITSLGLVVGEVTTQDSAGYAENVVISTSPDALSEVSLGSTVNIVVATGKVTIPNVVGTSVTTARSTLEALGLTVNAQPLYVCTGTDGNVVKQSPTAGKASQSTTVTLVYNLIDTARCASSSASASG